MGDEAQAEALLESLEARDDPEVAKLARATFFRQQGQSDRAIALLQELAQSSPEHVTRLASLYAAQGEVDKFDETIRDGLSRYPDHAELVNLRNRRNEALAGDVSNLPADAAEVLTTIQDLEAGNVTTFRSDHQAQLNNRSFPQLNHSQGQACGSAPQ